MRLTVGLLAVTSKQCSTLGIAKESGKVPASPSSKRTVIVRHASKRAVENTQYPDHRRAARLRSLKPPTMPVHSTVSVCPCLTIDVSVQLSGHFCLCDSMIWVVQTTHSLRTAVFGARSNPCNVGRVSST